MKVVFPFCVHDLPALHRLLDWIALLGHCQKHTALLVCDAAVQWSDGAALLNKAGEIFSVATLVANDKPVKGWPWGANSLWRTAAVRMKELGESWLWLEPDCVPICAGWLDKLQTAHVDGGKPYSGAIMDNTHPSFPRRYLAGPAVYPPSAIDQFGPFFGQEKAFDLFDVCSEEVVVQAHDHGLIQHLWGEKDLPPTFGRDRNESSPRNLFTLSHLKPRAVLFHRSKDGTLINLLRQQLFPNSFKKIMAVFPVCSMDLKLALKHARWLCKLGMARQHEALLSTDGTVATAQRDELLKLYGQCFAKVHFFRYQNPPRAGWPAAPNWAFQQTARYMERFGLPWLWSEADAVWMKRDTMERLQSEYDGCAKAFMGAVVPDLGHMNGVAVYPSNTPEIIPKAMRNVDRAWDYDAKHEISHDTHNSRLFFHAWLVDNGRIHPHGGQAPPDFSDENIVRQIPTGALIVHRCKHGHLVDRLMREFK